MTNQNITLQNGQVWQQLDFPYFKIVVIMLGPIDGNAVFCRASWNADSPPLVMTEKNGKWIYKKEEMLKHFKEKKYSLVGQAVGGDILL